MEMYPGQGVIDFWFDPAQQIRWWKKDVLFDFEIAQRFAALHLAATRGELFHSRESPPGRLAEIIVLDQFSRQIFRNQAQAFAFDGMALVLAQEAVAAGDDQLLPPLQRSFIYMPFMHSESVLIHEQALVLFTANGLEDNLSSEIRHAEIIRRFGRYPHRNAVLGRESNAAERSFLTEPSSSF